LDRLPRGKGEKGGGGLSKKTEHIKKMCRRKARIKG